MERTTTQKNEKTAQLEVRRPSSVDVQFLIANGSEDVAPEAPSRPANGKLKNAAARLKLEVLALYLAARDPRTPWYARFLVAAVVAYALSPIDLVPDFIPVIGLLDDLILVPIGIALAIRLIPDAVIVECRARAQTAFQSGQPVSRAAGAVVLSIWLTVAGILLWWLLLIQR
jgi:uncharacterized membrane protein YkvA (DUF1232 family)